MFLPEEVALEKSPDAFRTISEAADELDLPQHVLRFWETRFAQIKPLKRGGGRRYYRPDDVQLLKGIRHLLYDQGFTIKGVQRILKEQGAKHVIAMGEGGVSRETVPSSENIVIDGPKHDYVDFDDVEPPTLTHAPEPAQSHGMSDSQRASLQSALDTLENCRVLLDKARG